MLQFLFDTDHLTLFDHADVTVWRHFSNRSLGIVGISAVSVEEYLRGRLVSVARHQNGPLQVQAYANLIDSLALFQQLPIVPFDPACENRYQQLRRLRTRVGTQDLRIAAIALANNLILLTRNRRDFGRVPALTLDDWSV
ncbi:MAG TPA: type II toxin-antitoxin system VapC family toxin [Gemmataceae bacterium]|nr:type II toxin-antitoxin system VapC family toxin [Gemmataceae bacterium]